MITLIVDNNEFCLKNYSCPEDVIKDIPIDVSTLNLSNIGALWEVQWEFLTFESLPIFYISASEIINFYFTCICKFENNCDLVEAGLYYMYVKPLVRGSEYIDTVDVFKLGVSKYLSTHYSYEEALYAYYPCIDCDSTLGKLLSISRVLEDDHDVVETNEGTIIVYNKY